MCFIVSGSILISGWSFTSESLCRTAIDICLVFYIGDKMFLYLFLVERLRQVRASEVPRHKDGLFYIGVLIVLGGFGTLAVFAFLDPVASLAETDGRCRIGLPSTVTLPLLVYDVTINFLLTAVFWKLGLRYVRKQTSKKMVDILKSTLPFRKMKVIPTQENVLLFLMVKSTIGAMAIIVPTVVNIAILFVLHGHEQGWLCFSICIIDGNCLTSLFPLCHI